MDPNKLHDSMTRKLHGSWKVEDHRNQDAIIADKVRNECPWSQQEMLTGRPDQYVGGYDPAYIQNYRRQQEQKKKIKIDEQKN